MGSHNQAPNGRINDHQVSNKNNGFVGGFPFTLYKNQEGQTQIQTDPKPQAKVNLPPIDMEPHRGFWFGLFCEGTGSRTLGSMLVGGMAIVQSEPG